MKFFVIACCFMFLGVSLLLDFWKLLIASKHAEYAEGIHIVPILAMGSVFLGIYYNLTVWYKLTNRNMYGAYITIAGAVLTILLNVLLVPYFHYTGAAWATFSCYAFMMVVSYWQGQKYYPIPYALKKLLSYMLICVVMYMLHEFIAGQFVQGTTSFYAVYYGSSVLFFGLFGALIFWAEKNEIQHLIRKG